MEKGEGGRKHEEAFSVAGLSPRSAHRDVVVGTVPAASFKEDWGWREGEDKEVVAARWLRALERAGAESLAGRACKSEEEGATDMKGDRKFNFDSGRDVIAGGGGEEKHALQPFSTFL